MIIGIFGYDFTHFKTTEIIKNTVLSGHKVGAVFLAPKINYSNDGKFLSIDNSQVNNEARDFCKKHSIQVLSTKHNNKDLISSIVLSKDIDLGLIGGARLIPEGIISLFQKGIINYHPGKIPETSGLDSLYWSIKKNIPVFVTAHLIDEKVDAGLLILESRVKILIKDSLQVIRNRIMIKQLEINHKVLKGIEDKNFEFKKIIRPQKNERLSSKEISQIMKGFDRWKNFVSTKT